MRLFLDKVLQNKTVSVWGIGYLAYTTIVRLQALGYRCHVWDLFQERLGGLADGSYPQAAMCHNWSQVKKLPKLDISRIVICDNDHLDRMFDNAVHIVSFSGENYENPDDNHIRRLAVEFGKRASRLVDALVIFQSAEVPGNIDTFFLAPLAQAGVGVDCLSAFRSDWTLEEFLANGRDRVIAPTTAASLDKGRAFYALLGVRAQELPTIRAAEVYENARNALQYIVGAYFSQLALAYPCLDMNRILELVVESFKFERPCLTFGMAGNKMFSAVSNILEGSKHQDELTLVKEAQSVNTSLILKYGDYIVRNGYNSILILGLSTMGNIRLAEISPAVTLASYLASQGLRVFVDDPFYSPVELSRLLPFAEACDLEREGIPAEVLFILSDYYHLKFTSQTDLQRLGIAQVRLVLDNPGMLRAFSFPETTLYHSPGDGALDILENSYPCAE